MIDIHDFVRGHDADFARCPATNVDVAEAAVKLDVWFGPQLTEYLVRYGYLGFGSVEFYGVNGKQRMDSDMIIRTLCLRRQFVGLMSFVALENVRDEVYILIDANDFVFRYVAGEGPPRALEQKLFDYALWRFACEDVDKIV